MQWNSSSRAAQVYAQARKGQSPKYQFKDYEQARWLHSLDAVRPNKSGVGTISLVGWSARPTDIVIRREDSQTYEGKQRRRKDPASRHSCCQQKSVSRSRSMKDLVRELFGEVSRAGRPPA